MQLGLHLRVNEQGNRRDGPSYRRHGCQVRAGAKWDKISFFNKTITIINSARPRRGEPPNQSKSMAFLAVVSLFSLALGLACRDSRGIIFLGYSLLPSASVCVSLSVTCCCWQEEEIQNVLVTLSSVALLGLKRF